MNWKNILKMHCNSGEKMGCGCAKCQEKTKKALTGNQHRIDVAEPKGEITEADFDKLRRRKVKKSIFGKDPEEMTDFMNISPRMKTAKLERQILREIKKEGGALGMKNLKQFGKENDIKAALKKLEKEGKIFMHKDGDIYTHRPR
jgi:ABC-type enterochelin transport system substrate-binding protein|tara:strand:+ start:3010 stop:3444 length:435 start_codon:yes stop_codon:yes gene_type:complete